MEGWAEVRVGGRAALDLRVRGALARLVDDDVAARPDAWPEAARDVGAVLPLPGTGDTARLWTALATLGAIDLQLARAVAPHADALAILGEADRAGHDVPGVPGAVWGVYTTEGPGVRLAARLEGGDWLLDGTKPCCSLADRVSHALVTAWVDDERRGLFAVDLGQAGVRVAPGVGECHARGLRDLGSPSVLMDHVRARSVGPPGWYLERDGSAWGGIAEAAVWYGGAVGLARRLGAPGTRPRDQVSLAHLGEVDRRLSACRAVLHRAAADVDEGRAARTAGQVLASRVRAVVAGGCETVLTACEHDLGPGPQVSDRAYAARLADLRLCLPRQHAERDLADGTQDLVTTPTDSPAE